MEASDKNFTVKEYNILSSDGVHTLYGKIYIPNKNIKGIFHLVHGMTEYIGRYDHLMSFIALNGYICAGYDNLGHGKTSENDQLGFIAEKDGYKFLIRDVKLFEDKLKAEYKDLPLILMGHSMGSFIVRLAAEKYPESIDKLIICGTAGPNPIAPIGLLITDLISAFKGKHSYSKTVENIAFGAYNKHFDNSSKYNWLTKDKSVIEKYEKDKFCTFHFSVQAMHDLVKLNIECNKKRWFENLKGELDILIISGKDDPVGNYGKGVKAVYGNLLKHNKTKIKLKLYENCRHEIHNDTSKDEMFSDILLFIS